MTHPEPAHDLPLTPRRTVAAAPPVARRPRRSFKALTITVCILLILALTGFFAVRTWVQHALTAALPQIDGSLTLPGLTAPVTVQRDAHGVPHISAQSLDDLVLAQGFVTAQDRLFQM